MKKCNTCGGYDNCKDSFASWIFFIIGLIATVAVRVVTVLIHVDPVYARIAWYTGIGGFFAFFVYKFKVSQARAASISKQNLMEKINGKEILKDEDYSLISAILCGLSSRKERINYLFIFALSAVALILALYIDFFR